jgi:error-prone DNA polymerase
VLLAQTRARLRQPVALDHRRAPARAQGQYVAHPGDVEGKVPNAPTLAGLPDCLALLVPAWRSRSRRCSPTRCGSRPGSRTAPRSPIELLHRAGEDELVEVVRRVAHFTGLPIVAAATC